jgi:hypothetical protein
MANFDYLDVEVAADKLASSSSSASSHGGHKKQGQVLLDMQSDHVPRGSKFKYGGKKFVTLRDCFKIPVDLKVCKSADWEKALQLANIMVSVPRGMEKMEKSEVDLSEEMTIYYFVTDKNGVVERLKPRLVATAYKEEPQMF